MSIEIGNAAIVRRNMSGHADYPHEAGTLYDCTACEANCFCAEVQAGQVDDAEDTEPTICVHCAIGEEHMQAHADRKFGRRS
jgi:hypothetical protein